MKIFKITTKQHATRNLYHNEIENFIEIVETIVFAETEADAFQSVRGEVTKIDQLNSFILEERTISQKLVDEE